MEGPKLESGNEPRPRSRTVWVSTTMIVLLLASLLGGIVAYVAPRTYESRCVIELLPASPEVAKLNEGETLADQVRTAAVVMVSRAVLMRVSDAQDLTMRWGLDSETVILILKGVVSAEVIPDTTLIEICTRHTDAEDSRDVAMETVKAYRDRLQEIEESRIALEIDGLNRQYGNLEAEASQLSKRLDVDAPDGVICDKLAAVEAMMARIAEEKEGIWLRHRAPIKRVVIHEQPILARAPVEPNLSMILANWSLGGLGVGLLLGCWVSGWVRAAKAKPDAEPEPEWREADAW